MGVKHSSTVHQKDDYKLYSVRVEVSLGRLISVQIVVL